MKNTELLNIKNEFSITTEILEDIKKPFYELADSFIQELQAIDEILAIWKDESKIDESLVKKAKRLKLDIAKIRTTTWKVKDNEKKEVLQRWNAIQACHNVIVKTIEDKEEELEKIVKYFENKEKERLNKLQKEREEEIKPYIQEISDLIALCNMEEDKYKAFYLMRKREFEEKKELEEKLEKERIEKERLAEEERVKQIKENARIEAEAKVMREKIEAEMKAKADLERVEKEKQEAIDKLKKEQEIKELAEKKRKEDEENARIEAEKKVKEEKELLAKRQEFINYRDSLDFDHYEDQDWFRIFYKRVWEFKI